MIKEDMKYSEAVAELEAITAKMQSPECDIDSLASMTSRALELLKFCKENFSKQTRRSRNVLKHWRILYEKELSDIPDGGRRYIIAYGGSCMQICKIVGR